MAVIDVTEADFATQVVEGSRSIPVVVDFWAAWCGPCRQLTPVLERAADAREGKVVLAKLDTEANPNLARQFAIQSIPAVKAFRDGRVVDEFVGALPPAGVERFFDTLVPSEADELVGLGDEDSLRRALVLDPNRADAAVALATLLHARGDTDDALTLVAPIRGNFRAEGLAARIHLERAGDEIDLTEALAALDAGDDERAIDLLLQAMVASEGHKEDLRQLVVGILDRLGVEHPVSRDARRRLAAALY